VRSDFVNYHCGMTELTLNGAEWKTRDDVYDSFFRAVGAPDWHGRNFNALRDSIATGSINTVEVPYRLVIQNYDKIAPSARQMADDFVDLIRELAAEGCPVEIRPEGQ
jgi:RNAse (barnase) inhibitor barstar